MRDGVSKLDLYLSFFIGKALHFCLNGVVPTILLGLTWWQGVALYAFICAIQSGAFVTMLVGTHFFDGTECPQPSEKGLLDHGWAEHQLMTSADWSPESRIASFVSGGANAHLAHHPSPAISHVHYRLITPLIARTTEEFGLPYHRMSLWQMIRSHFTYLRAVGKPTVQMNIEPDL